MRRLLMVLILMLIVAAGVPTARADAVTTCAFGGPTGVERHMQLNLPDGAANISLALEPPAVTSAGTSRASRHLLMGVLVIDLDTKEVVTSRLFHRGVDSRRGAVVTGAESVAVETRGPGLPLETAGGKPVPGLGPGRYGVVAFGSDGGAALPNPYWKASISVSGKHKCSTEGSDRITDMDTTDATSGTVVTAGPALIADGAGIETRLRGDLVIAVLSAFGGVGSDASVTFKHPSGRGVVNNALLPFASAPGAFEWRVDAMGPAAAADVLAVEVAW